ncbi:MAG: hypothetical protein ACOC7J_07570 [Armatimonadota bacterium]
MRSTWGIVLMVLALVAVVTSVAVLAGCPAEQPDMDEPIMPPPDDIEPPIEEEEPVEDEPVEGEEVEEGAEAEGEMGVEGEMDDGEPTEAEGEMDEAVDEAEVEMLEEGTEG